MRKFLLVTVLITIMAIGAGGVQGHALAAEQAIKAILNWSDYPAGTVYDGVIIQRKNVGGTYAEVGRVAKHVTSFTDLNVVAGQSYCWALIGFSGSTLAAPGEGCSMYLPSLTGLVITFAPVP